MNDIIRLINESNAKTIGKVDDSIILEAEKELDFKFDNEYKIFIKNFGVLRLGSSEVFGLGVDGYLNIVNTTVEEREIYGNILKEFIVIQDYGIGGILITLDEDGSVYEFRNNINKKIYNSFYDFLKNEIIK